PVAAGHETDPNKWERQAGDFIFSLNNRDRHEYNSTVTPVRIIRPWTNELAFRTPDGSILPPRMKAVHYLCQRSEDHDDKLDLLPAPIHRYEINGLTMLPQFDRD